MASKHFRKLEEERMLAAAAAANAEAEVSDAEPAPQATGFSFADLADESSDDSSSDSEDERERRAAAAEARSKGQGSTQQQIKQKQQAQKKRQQQELKKTKKKEKAGVAGEDWSLNNDELLASIAAAQAASTAETDVLQPDPKFLDPQSELKRIFGGNVVKAAMREEQQERRAASGRRGRGGTFARLRRAILVQPRDHWPPYTPGGLEMQVAQTTGEEVMFCFRHGDDYKQAQREYEVAASSHDPNAIVGVLQFYPYHIGSLMQLAEVHSIRGGELERAGDMYERALFAMERGTRQFFCLPCRCLDAECSAAR